MLVSVFTKATRDRWKGIAVAVVSLGLVLLMAMAVYQDFDLRIYDGLPEAFRSIVGIPDGADVAGIAIGVMYSFYGAMTLAGLAISMGSASIAGEERDGTIGLLLANPKSRTHVLVSKAVSMAVLVGVGTLGLLGAALLSAGILDVELTGMEVGAYAVHLFVNALFYGFLALAVGAWTGNRGLASGISVTVMILGFLAGGIFPLIRGWENVAKAFPWYYFDGSDPVVNGLDWGHVGILLAGIVVLAAAAILGVNRRDLKGQSVGVTLLDRLRANPTTQKVADRLAGSARVSRIWVKTASEHQGLLIVTAYAMFLIMGIMMGPMYSLLDETMLRYARDIPDALYAFVGAGAGGGDMSTPEGFYEVETFGLMAPIAVMVVTVTLGARALAGEEQRGTMGLLLANPIRRSTVVLEKTLAMVVYALAVSFATFTGVWFGSLLAGLGMDAGNIAATTLLATLVGLVFGGLALALSAATGRVRVAVFGTVGVAAAFHVLTSIAALSEGLTGVAKWSPFHYYLTTDPLTTGMDWGNGAVLAGIAIVLVALSVVFFDRRDLRQKG